MKKGIHIFVALILVSAISELSSCKKALIADYTIADATLCISATTLAAHYQLINFQINHNDIVTTVNSAGAKDVSRVTDMSLKQMKAVVTNTGGNFDQIGTIEVYFKTSANATDSIQIAYQNVFHTGDTQTVLQVNGGDLKSALSSDPTLVLKVLNNTIGNTTCVKLTQGIIEMSIRE